MKQAQDTISADSVETLKDDELLALSLEKPSVFAHIVDRYQEKFLRRARKILGSAEAAEDVVQDTFVKIYLKGRKFRKVEGASFSSWAYKILLNSCFTEYKKMSRRRDAVVPFDEELQAVMGENGGFEKRFEMDYFLSILGKIPEALRAVLRLSVLSGLSPVQIAEKEGVSVGAVRTRMHRARKAFQKATLE